MVENLFGFVTGGIEIDLGLAVDGTLAGLRIVAIDGGRGNKTGEGVESFFVLALPAEAHGGADAGQVDGAQEGSGEVVDANFGARVFQVCQEK